MSDNYDESKKKYEQSEKGKARKRKFMKQYRERPEVQEREKSRDRREYMREYMKKKRAEAKERRDSQGS